MKTKLAVLTLVVVLLAMPTIAEAQRPVHQKIYPPGRTTGTWQNVIALETLDVVTTSASSYRRFWMFAVVDSLGATPTFEAIIQYRYRHSLPTDPATYYYGAWSYFDTLTVTDTLYAGEIYPGDTINFHNDIQVRAHGGALTDSVKIRVYLEKRPGH